MKKLNTLIAITIISFGFFSCEKDDSTIDSANQQKSQGFKFDESKIQTKQSLAVNFENDLVQDFKVVKPKFDAVEGTACNTSSLNLVTNAEYNILVDSIIKIWDRQTYNPINLVYNDYFTINNYAAQLGINADYFGKDGEYTNYVKQEKSSLEKFWQMPDLIYLRGQHSATLENLDVIRYMYTYYSDYGLIADDQILDEDDEIFQQSATIDEIVAIAKYFNTHSDEIPENSVYASDAFATRNGTIVLGDGIIDLLVKTGLEDKIVISSILSHEWAHQIQFTNINNWQYPIEAFPPTPDPESGEDIAANTRMTELEADFFTGFYLTHKRGGTYNWKRVEEVLSTFYGIGDCSFGSNGHHGTPTQRLKSAKAGYEYAKSLQQKGFLPDPTTVHDEFLSNFEDIL